MADMQTDHTNKKKYLVWVAINAGRYILADDVVVTGTTVAFMLRDHLVDSFLLSDFLVYNDLNIKPVGDK
jgi:hypothetical protein